MITLRDETEAVGVGQTASAKINVTISNGTNGTSYSSSAVANYTNYGGSGRTVSEGSDGSSNYTSGNSEQQGFVLIEW